MEVTKEEFIEWRHSHVTKQFQEFVQSIISQAKETLAETAGLEPLQDRHLVGGIDALKDVLEWNPVKSSEPIKEEDQNGY